MKVTMMIVIVCLSLSIGFFFAATLVIRGKDDCRYTDYVNLPCADYLEEAEKDVLLSMSGILLLVGVSAPVLVHYRRRRLVSNTPRLSL
jgi:hypothetical protein